jgi:hypothetical protein
MSRRFDEFRDDDDNDNDEDDAGVAPRPPADVPLVIGVRAGASVASSGAASLGLQFRQIRRTFEELREGEVIARKQDRGAKGSKIYIAIRKSATMPLPDKLLGPRFLGAKNSEGELLNHNKSIQDDYLSNLQALKPIIDQMTHFDMKGILNFPLVYDDTGLIFEDRWGFNNPNFSLIDISQNWNQVTMSHCENWQRDVNDHAVDADYESSVWTKELLEGCLDPELKKQVKDKYNRLNLYKKGGITYFKIVVDTVFKMSSLTVKSLKKVSLTSGRTV